MANLQQQICDEISVQMRLVEARLLAVINERLDALAHDRLQLGLEVKAQLGSEVKAQLEAQLGMQLQSQAQAQSQLSCIGDQLGEKVYSQIIKEINTTIVPRIDKMVEWINYNIQDDDNTVRDYLSAVELVSNPTGSLTNGKTDSRFITPYVRTFFENESESSASSESEY